MRSVRRDIDHTCACHHPTVPSHQLHDHDQLVLLDDAIQVLDDVRVLHLLQQSDLVHAFITLLRSHLENLNAKGKVSGGVEGRDSSGVERSRLDRLEGNCQLVVSSPSAVHH